MPWFYEGQPIQTIICIAVNQIAYPLPQGGRMKAGDSIRPMTQVTIVSQDKESVNRVVGEVMHIHKHR
jgi:ribosomal protein L19